jgi:hypothetical protein
MGDQSLTAFAAPAQPRHVGRNGGLVDEDKPARIKQALLAHPTSARPHHVCSFLLRRARGLFFKGGLVPFEEPPDSLRLPAIPCWRMTTTISSKVKSGCLATGSSNQAASASNGDVLPPSGFFAALPNRTKLAPTGLPNSRSPRSVPSPRAAAFVFYEALVAKISAHEYGHNSIRPSISLAQVVCAAWLL